MLKFFFELKMRLECLTIYRAILQDEVIQKLCLVLNDIVDDKESVSGFLRHYAEFIQKLADKNPELNLCDYLTEIVLFDDNVFSSACERHRAHALNAEVMRAARRDLESLYLAACLSPQSVKVAAIDKFGSPDISKDLIHHLPEWVCGAASHDDDQNRSLFLNCRDGNMIKTIAHFYMENGAGLMARYRGFVWEKDGPVGILRGIPSPDPVRFSDLIGYTEQKEALIDNTLQFLRGYAANNVLLYGPRGTGKSSAVKALLNEYGHRGLRLIELPKSYLNDLHHILRIIKDRPQRFIIFIDDLVFGDNEAEYTSLKAVLEGGLESKPHNVLIYATSNRRHLIKERFSERQGYISDSEDDIHAGDTMQEKLSLADRFGLTITFSAPDQRKYLEIVDGIAKSRGLPVEPETLHREALIWEMRYNGRSGRTARQFIDWVEGRHHE